MRSRVCVACWLCRNVTSKDVGERSAGWRQRWTDGSQARRHSKELELMFRRAPYASEVVKRLEKVYCEGQEAEPSWDEIHRGRGSRMR